MLALMQSEPSQEITGDHEAYRKVPSDFSDAIFARRLKDLRTLAGITQQQLADRMTGTGHKVYRSTVGKIENGQQPASIGLAVQLAGALDVPLMELVTDPGATAEQEREHRARVEAQMAVRTLKRQAADYHKLLTETQILLDNTLERLKGAEQRLAGLGGELPWDSPGIESMLPMEPRSE